MKGKAAIGGLVFALLAGCGGPEAATPRSTPAEVSAPVVTEMVQLVLDYETVSTGYSIQRRRLDPKGLDLNVYFDVPVFEEMGEGYAKINAFFAGLAEDFFSPENPNLETIWDVARDGRADLCYKWTAQVTFWDEKLVSVTHSYVWLAGGVKTLGSNGYTFRTDTGELLTLEEVTGESEEAVRDSIEGALKRVLEERRSDVESCLAAAEEYDIEEFDFALDEDGFVVLYFDSGELGRSTAESSITVHPWLMVQ